MSNESQANSSSDKQIKALDLLNRKISKKIIGIVISKT